MKEKESGLRGKQESQIAILARKALDQGNSLTVISLLESATMFLPQNLVTIVSVVVFGTKDKDLQQRARKLLISYLELCPNAQSLVGTMVWANHPKRRRSIPDMIRALICNRRRVLDPDWVGEWENPSIGSSNRAVGIRKKKPNEVDSPEDCLIGASQQGALITEWMQRYVDLGGNPDSSKCLKIWAACAVGVQGRLSNFMIGKLRSFVKIGEPYEVKKFLRKATAAHENKQVLKLKKPNYDLSRFALLLYCTCNRFERFAEDWVHIAKSAMFLNLPVVEKIVQHILASHVHDTEALKMFDQLSIRNGKICVTQNHARDLGLGNNSIWRDVRRLLPVDANASAILFTYSEYELSLMEQRMVSK